MPYIQDLLTGIEVHNYHEPFAGGAAVFFGIPQHGQAFLSDLNADLIETYSAVKLSPEDVWQRLRKYKNTETDYYAVRSRRPITLAGRAARFIYLNHTSYNGIYRVNLRGEYNVPFGHKATDNRPKLAHLVAASKRLQRANLEVGDFSAAIERVEKDDFIFLDPPYTVAHNNNGFVKYNDKLFQFVDQERLSAGIDEIRSKGAYYVLTNAAHESIAELFEKGDYRVQTSRRNSIGGRSAARGRATEFLFTNLPIS
ncbi:site-specific DNA-methyltransferase (adenine-specific) [Brevibacterium sediminis]|uniref:Site-specific DNA-methyltransferase (adenine-specific) n=1 Tax=Brevibacterium sediminis TaxID=1857024 RepID=A0ABQ1MT80_9MICO|nr:site-specific DNA-methyltransferase (adenine-specific) [Brevibacterium sediminis]